ncbi:MAG: heparinase II/III family protein [Paludibacter sp.]
MNQTIRVFVGFLFAISTINAAEHPNLFLTSKGVQEIKSSLGKYLAFDKSLSELKAIADKALAEKIEVPVPKDGGGGYSHEKHKNNYYAMNAAGILFQISADKKYADFVRDMLMKYAELYPTLPLHPVIKSEARGKLFWQTLNDAVWLVHTANAYDCVYNFMADKDRQLIEKNLFRPMAEFLSNGNPGNYATFNKMHNHGTWALSAVGMIGYAMGDKELVAKTLYGSNKDGKSGFFRQLDMLFSPDGYYTEGPYYQRYAIWPFMTFAQVIQNQQPELNIFKYRDGILQKAVNTSLQCAYNGEFFKLNDALDKTYATQEIVYAVDIAYKNNPANKQLLDIARVQNSYLVSEEGLSTAKAVSMGNIPAFETKSTLLHDGAKGDEGGIAILRSGMDSKQSCLTFKATSHGLSHGHFDKLSMIFYDNGNCILPDYGSVRFLNIEPKDGGGYTKENHTWGMQTIAHNTVTVDGVSNFNGDIKISSQFHSDLNYFDCENTDIQVISAVDSHAYEAVNLNRTMAMIKNKAFEYPIVLDIFRIKSDSTHQLDLPFYYNGQMISTDFTIHKNTTNLKPLGKKNGYQHLWLEATGNTEKESANFTFLNENRFYSITTLTDAKTQFMMTRIGAGDPDFNLRNTACFLVRQPNASTHTFVSLIEPHGLYDLKREITENYETNLTGLNLIKEDEFFSAVKISLKNGQTFLFITLNRDFGNSKLRTITINDKKISFIGNYYFSEIQN